MPFDVDIDIDTENKHEWDTAFINGELQDGIEADRDKLGKIVVVNDNDDDGDGIPDFADGYNLDGVAGNADDRAGWQNPALPADQRRNEKFVLIKIRIPTGINLDRMTLEFIYDASLPTGVTSTGTLGDENNPLRYTLPSDGGQIRLWRKDGSEARDKSPVSGNPAGDFIDANQQIPLTGNRFIFDGDGIATIWVEAVAPSVQIGEPFVQGRLRLDGEIRASDTIRMTSAKIDLDVNEDKDLNDPLDGAVWYLPGYWPASDPTKYEATLSTGVTFNTPEYNGQHMYIVAQGIGSGSGLDEIRFKIATTTSLPGFAENASHPNVEGSGNNHDYSFSELSNDIGPKAGTMADGKTWIDLWAKDYGGRAKIRVEGVIGGTTFLLKEIFLPQDHDLDGMADLWERNMVTLWNQQSGTSEPIGLDFFGANDDLSTSYDDRNKELLDPDGSNTDGGDDLPDHAAMGDKFTNVQEFRGFILDGGGHDWDGNNPHSGGHTRLSPVYKEFLVEVDAMDRASTPHMPDRAGIIDWMNAITIGMSQKVAGTGTRMYYALDKLDTPHDTFVVAGPPGAAHDAAQSAVIKTYLSGQINPKLTSFTHLQLLDGFDLRGTSGLTWTDVGATYATNQGHAFATWAGIAFDTSSTSYISHELHHAQTKLATDPHDPGAGGHFNDTNGNGIDGEADDQTRVLWNYNYAYPTRALTASITSTATAIPIDSTADLTSHGFITIGTEWIEYAGISGNTLTGCTRGKFGTTAAAYTSGTAVQPVFSAEDYKQIRYGAGTLKYIDLR